MGNVNIFWIDIEPMGAVRMTKRGKWVKDNAQRYLTYKELVAWQIKGLFDAANGLIWKDDSQVAKTEAVKIYDLNPGIWMEVMEVS